MESIPKEYRGKTIVVLPTISEEVDPSTIAESGYFGSSTPEIRVYKPGKVFPRLLAHEVAHIELGHSDIPVSDESIGSYIKKEVHAWKHANLIQTGHPQLSNRQLAHLVVEILQELDDIKYRGYSLDNWKRVRGHLLRSYSSFGLSKGEMSRGIRNMEKYGSPY